MHNDKDGNISNYIKYSYIKSKMTSISFYLGMHCSMHNFLGINKLVHEPC